jgi:hypothetical protein
VLQIETGSREGERQRGAGPVNPRNLAPRHQVTARACGEQGGVRIRTEAEAARGEGRSINVARTDGSAEDTGAARPRLWVGANVSHREGKPDGLRGEWGAGRRVEEGSLGD